VPASQIRKYLFEGFNKTIYPYVPFDFVPEKEFASVLENDPTGKNGFVLPKVPFPFRIAGSLILQTLSSKPIKTSSSSKLRACGI
jgi:hypothetical protein